MQHQLTMTWVRGSETLGQTVTLTGDGENGADLSIPTGVTDQEVQLAYTVANLKSFFALSDQAVTLKTNSSGAPQDTFSLAANVPLIKFTGDGHDAIFAGNVTKFYVTNASGATATINIRGLFDATP